MHHTRLICALLALVGVGQVSGTATDVLTIAPGVEVVPGSFSPGSQPDGNSVVLASRDGLIVIDTGRHAAHTNRVIELATSKHVAIATVVNTHWHLDHIGGNPRIRAQFPAMKAYASTALQGALDGFLATYKRDLETAIARPETSEPQRTTYRIDLDLLSNAAALAPDVVIAQEGSRSFGGRTLEIHIERAATRGDLWLVDRESQVLIAGDLVTLPAPFLDTACPRRWSDALGRLEATEFRTLIPGHGAPMSRADLTMYRRAFDGLLACAASSATETECAQRWITQSGKLVPVDVHGFTRGMIGYYTKEVLRNEAVIAASCND